MSGTPSGAGGPQKYIRHIRGMLITAVIAVFALRIIVWLIEPFIPYIIIGLVLVSVLGYLFTLLFHRSGKL